MADIFTIDKEIQSYLPPPTADELARMEKNILASKHVDDLVILTGKDFCYLGDGHNRLGLCKKHKIEYGLREIKVKSREEALDWVIDNQLGRRNLTDEARAYYIGKKYLGEKRESGRPEVDKNTKPGQSDQVKGETAQIIGKTQGVSEKTVRRSASFADAVDAVGAVEGPQAKAEILNGHAGKSRAEIIKDAPILCARCQRAARVGQPATKGCSMCKELREPKKKVVKEKEAPVDSFGVEIPKRCRDAYGDPWIQEAIDFLGVMSANFWGKRLADDMTKRKKHYPFFNVKDFVDGCGFAGNYIDTLLEHLKTNRPAGVCPTCKGDGCSECKMSGLVPRDVHKELTKKAKK